LVSLVPDLAVEDRVAMGCLRLWVLSFQHSHSPQTGLVKTALIYGYSQIH
jgi:hypothetical protein